MAITVTILTGNGLDKRATVCYNVDMTSERENMKTTKQWKIGDKVTPIQGYLKGVPCVIKWRGWSDAESPVTVETVHGCWRSIHPNNLKKI